MNKEFIARWFRAFLVTLGIFVLFSFYLFIRREIYNLGIANKAFGSAAAVVAGMTLLIGPVSRMLPRFGKFLVYRRPLGVMAFLTGSIHAIISLFFIPDRFNISFFLNEWPATATGLLAIGIWFYLTSISRNEKIQQLGGSKWIMLQQRGGHIAFIAVFFHLIFLKWAGWLVWFQGKTQKTALLANPGY
ncbi:hypothetical protein HY410_01685, partial [Candidatus Gottesmanbacteria bacterium]|nr:hypothetical protein [Candidatus Gottesmanbacteria bacterium]